MILRCQPLTYKKKHSIGDKSKISGWYDKDFDVKGIKKNTPEEIIEKVGLR